jgi:glycosyltransferase involved in cell wall biosynthesis
MPAQRKDQMVHQSVQAALATGLAQARSVLLFDLEDIGHHAVYIRHLVSYWNAQKFPGRLVVLVTPTFLERHVAVANLARYKSANVEFQAISIEEEADLRSLAKKSRLSLRFQEMRLLNHYIQRFEIDRCLIMFIDKLQIPLLSGLYPACEFSGIYFRPSFHYASFSQRPTSWSARLQSLRERVFLYRLLRHSQINRLLCLDPLVSHLINQMTKTDKALTLADPVDEQAVNQATLKRIRRELKIEPHRKIFFIFGELSGRKGIVKVLEALEILEAADRQQICLLIVGQMAKAAKIQIAEKIERLAQGHDVQIVTHCEFVPDDDVPAYFEIADVVLALYQQHVGMSGILLLAAQHQKPVLSTDYGLMGELVRRYRLGVTVDSADVSAIAGQLSQLAKSDLSAYFDSTSARRLVKENTVAQFTAAIFKVLLA